MASLLGAFFLQSEGGAAGIMAALGFVWLIMMAFAVLIIAAMWKVFTKAGEPGWASIVPIYHAFVLLRIARKPMWWFILFLIPLVNLVIAVLVSISVAQNFGKGAGFGLGLCFLGFIFYPMLAWGDATFQPQS